LREAQRIVPVIEHGLDLALLQVFLLLECLLVEGEQGLLPLPLQLPLLGCTQGNGGLRTILRLGTLDVL
jgi:hypothetical protein